jgi:hypothetical protein
LALNLRFRKDLRDLKDLRGRLQRLVEIG